MLYSYIVENEIRKTFETNFFGALAVQLLRTGYLRRR